MAEVVITYLHYISFMALFAAIVLEHLLTKKTVTVFTIRRLAKIDTIVGICAVIALATGLLKVFVVGKPAAYYFKNFLFHTKLTLFFLVAFVSIVPTIYYLKSRKKTADKNENDEIEVPARIIHILRLELLGIILLPLLGVLMARGFGAFS